MSKWISLIAFGLLLSGCGSKPAPQQTTQLSPPVQQSPLGQPADQPPVGSQPDQAAPQDGQPPAAQGPEFVIPGGTQVRVRLNRELDTRRNRAGDRFTATLVVPIEDGGRVVLPHGTQFSGHVTAAKPSGRMRGRAVLGVTLDSFTVNGATYSIATTSSGRTGKRHRKRNLVLIGGGAGTGAAIGGIAGGGEGALIGAGAGAVAGTIGAVFSGKKEIALPAETLLTFRLEENVEM